MAFSLNKTMLIGNLGQDAETRFTTNNLSITTFSLATTRSWKDKEGNWQNEATWHNIIAFNLADFYKAQLLKGKKFYVEGRISKRDYTDKEGVKRYVTEIVSEQLIPLTANGERAEHQNHEEKQSSYSEPEPSASVEEDLPF